RTLRKLEMSASKLVSATFRGRFKFAPLIAIPVLLFVYVLMTNSWRIVSVQDTPSQSAKIELQSAKSELPGSQRVRGEGPESQTVKGEGPDSQTVKGEGPDSQTVKREGPDSQTAKSEVLDRQFLIGTWRSHQMENGQDVLIYWTIKGDGTTSYDYY